MTNACAKYKVLKEVSRTALAHEGDHIMIYLARQDAAVRVETSAAA